MPAAFAIENSSRSHRFLEIDPIGWLKTSHRMQLLVCNLLEELMLRPQGQRRESMAREALRVLRDELPAHVNDEDVDVRNAMAGVYAPDGWLDAQHRLYQRHTDHLQYAYRLEDGLTALSLGGAPADSASFVAAGYGLIERLRKDLTWENEVVLPYVQASLSEDELDGLGRRFADRRQRMERIHHA